MSDIYELMKAVREHPDFAFGVIWTREDFTDGKLPEDASFNRIEEMLTSRGNDYLDQEFGYDD